MHCFKMPFYHPLHLPQPYGAYEWLLISLDDLHSISLTPSVWAPRPRTSSGHPASPIYCHSCAEIGPLRNALVENIPDSDHEKVQGPCLLGSGERERQRELLFSLPLPHHPTPSSSSSAALRLDHRSGSRPYTKVSWETQSVAKTCPSEFRPHSIIH